MNTDTNYKYGASSQRPLAGAEMGKTGKVALTADKLAALLRRLGTVVLLASAVTFILQGWMGWDSITRYYCFLLFTIAISGAGLFCGLVLKDAKGARTFLGVAAAVAPAHFAQLGAFFYSLTNSHPFYVPDAFLYQAPSWIAAIGTLALALLVLVPILFASFSALARSHARELLLCYLAANAALLVPTRAAGPAALLGLVVFGATMLADMMLFRDVQKLKNREGMLARWMLFSPAAVILARNLLLCDATAALYGAVCACLAIYLLSAARAFEVDAKWTPSLEAASVPFAAAAAMYLSYSVFFSRDGMFNALMTSDPEGLAIPLLSFPACALVSISTDWMRKLGFPIKLMATKVFGVAALLHLAVEGGFGAALICVIAGICITVRGFTVESKTLTRFGILIFAAGLLYNFKYAIQLYSISPWVSLALIGSVVIIGSSYLERKDKKLFFELSEFAKRFKPG